EYFSIIELIAFSYAISGCSFSMSEIQRLTNPFHRFAKRVKKPPPSAILDSPYFAWGSCSLGDSLTTRATASLPKHSRTSCTCSFASLHDWVRAYCDAT